MQQRQWREMSQDPRSLHTHTQQRCERSCADPNHLARFPSSQIAHYSLPHSRGLGDQRKAACRSKHWRQSKRLKKNKNKKKNKIN